MAQHAGTCVEKSFLPHAHVPEGLKAAGFALQRRDLAT